MLDCPNFRKFQIHNILMEKQSRGRVMNIKTFNESKKMIEISI